MKLFMTESFRDDSGLTWSFKKRSLHVNIHVWDSLVWIASVLCVFCFFSLLEDSKSLCHPILKLPFCIRFPRKFLEAPLLGILQTIVLPTGLLTTFTFWLIQIYFESYSHQSVEDSFDSESTGDMGYKSNSLWKVPPLVFLVKSKERISQRGDGARATCARDKNLVARAKKSCAPRAQDFLRVYFRSWNLSHKPQTTSIFII